MERLTYIKRPNSWDRGQYPTKYTSRHTFQEVVGRLAAYEDTGLEPEEVLSLLSVREITPEAEYAINKHANSLIERMDALIYKDDGELEAYRSVGDLDYLQKLAQAEKEGRLVVLPVQGGGYGICHIRRGVQDVCC